MVSDTNLIGITMNTTTNQAQELLQALGNPEGWNADGDSLYADRALTVGDHTWYLRAAVRCADVTVDSALGHLTMAVGFVDSRLVGQAVRAVAGLDADALSEKCRFGRFCDEVAA